MRILECVWKITAYRKIFCVAGVLNVIKYFLQMVIHRQELLYVYIAEIKTMILIQIAAIVKEKEKGRKRSNEDLHRGLSYREIDVDRTSGFFPAGALVKKYLIDQPILGFFPEK